MGKYEVDAIFVSSNYRMQTTDTFDVWNPDFRATIHKLAAEYSPHSSVQHDLVAKVISDLSLYGERDKTAEWYVQFARNVMQNEMDRRRAEYLTK